MVTISFKKAYSMLNLAQKRAVDTIEGPVMVVAGPGTGKTQILTLRIANILLHTQVNPENILALTFTESGVLAMRKRLVEMIGTDGYRVAVFTFHGFCNDVIKKNIEHFPDLISAESITEVDQVSILEEILNQLNLEHTKPFGDPYYYLKSLLQAINELKKDAVSPMQLTDALDAAQQDLGKVEDLHHQKGAYKGQIKGKYQDLQKEINKNRELVVVYSYYQNYLKEHKLYDFSDMLLFVLNAFETDQNLLMKMWEQYQYLLVDEHQDSNFAQNKLIELLCSYFENPNLFVVGDDKQAIYRFQGASLENFLYFQSIYKQAVLINLEENYRSSQTILDAASSLIKNNITSEVLSKNIGLKSQLKHKPEPIKIVSLTDYYAEFDFIAKDILEKNAKGVLFKDIAVLVRNNRDVTPLGVALTRNKVPYVIESDQDILADLDIQKMIWLIRTVCNFGEEVELARILHADFWQIDPIDIYKILVYAKKQNQNLYTMIAKLELLVKASVSDPNQFLSIYQKLNQWKKLCHNENAAEVFVRLLKESKLLDLIVKKPNKYEILDKFAALYTQIHIQSEKDPNFNLHAFLGYITLVETHQILIKRPSKLTSKNAVKLMTAHKSKGLEFGFVYITQAYDGHWGNKRARGAGFKLPREYLGMKLKLGVALEEIEDERRLFFVALTRAKEQVTITYSTSSLDGKEQFQSQFIEEIDQPFKQLVDVSQFEEDFINQKEQLFYFQDQADRSDDQEFIQTKELFSETFLEQGLSITGLNNYLKCPWSYVYRNLLGIPEEKTKNQIFGTVIHKTINRYINESKKVTPGLSLVLNTYHDLLVRSISKGSVFDQLLEKGKICLTSFFDSEMKYWQKDLLSEYNVSEVFLTDEIFIKGTIDLIKPLDRKKSVCVYDFKTGMPKSRGVVIGTTKSSDGDYFRQLVFYKLLLERKLGQLMQVENAVISFVEPDAKGRYRKEEFLISDTETDALAEQIKQVADEIINLTFWKERCDDLECEYCLLRNKYQIVG